MKKLTDLWARVTGKDSSQISDSAANSEGIALLARVFVKAFNRCPICDLDFIDHYFTLMSVIPAYRGEAVTDLVNKVKNHEWTAVHEIQEFEPSEDAIAIYVLRCPGTTLAVAIVEDPVELYYNPSIIDHEVLDSTQSQQLRTALGERKWFPVL